MLFKDTGSEEELAGQLIQPVVRYIEGELLATIKEHFDSYYDILSACDLYESATSYLEPILSARAGGVLR